MVTRQLLLQQAPSLQRQYGYADALKQYGGSSAPVQSGFEGLVRALNGVAGGVVEGMANRKLDARVQEAQNQLAQVLRAENLTPRERAIQLSQIAGLQDIGLAQVLQPEPKDTGFTLGEGQVRFDGSGGVVARGPEKQKTGMSLTVGQDGNINFTQGGVGQSIKSDPANVRTQVRDDVKAVTKSREKAGNSVAMENMASDTIDALQTFETGAFGNIRGQYEQLKAYLGSDTADDQAQAFEAIQRASKKFGIEELKNVGGNDTERELAVAIQTNIDVNNRPETNMRIALEREAAFKIAAQEPQFKEQWVKQYGMLSNSNEAGESFSTVWHRVQKQQFDQARGEFEKILGVREREAQDPDLLNYMTPEERALFE